MKSFLMKLLGIESDVERLGRLQANHDENVKTYAVVKERLALLCQNYNELPEGKFKEDLEFNIERIKAKLDEKGRIIAHNALIITMLQNTLHAQGAM